MWIGALKLSGEQDVSDCHDAVFVRDGENHCLVRWQGRRFGIWTGTAHVFLDDRLQPAAKTDLQPGVFSIDGLLHIMRRECRVDILLVNLELVVGRVAKVRMALDWTPELVLEGRSLLDRQLWVVLSNGLGGLAISMGPYK